MNAEVSDSCYGIHFLESYGIDYRTELIIYNLCGTDAVQSFWGYGANVVFRIDPEGDLRLREDRNLNHGHRQECGEEYTYPVQGNVSQEKWLTVTTWKMKYCRACCN